MMKNYYYNVLKLENGYARVRDYNLDECLKAGANLVLKYSNKEMIVKHGDIKEKFKKIDDKLYPSKFKGGRNYKNLHIKWESSENEKVTNTPTLFDNVQLNTNSI